MERDAWNARYADTELLWGVRPNRFVEREVGDLAAGRAVDLACGEGRNAIWLATRGWQVTAVDFADVAIDKGRKLAVAENVDVDWHVDDVRTWAPGPGAFDLVLLAYLQLPLDERTTVFANAAAGVAPRGTFLLVAHDARNIADGHGGPQLPEVLCRADEVVTHLDGFDIVYAGEVLRPVTRDDGSTVHAIDTLVRATRR